MLLGCPGVAQRLSEVARGMLSEAIGSCRKLSEAVRSCQTPPNTLWAASGQRLTASDSVVSYDHQFPKFN